MDHRRGRPRQPGGFQSGGSYQYKGDRYAGGGFRPDGQTPHSLSAYRQLYEREFPVYKQPVEVGFFSLDLKRNFFNDSRQLRYYVDPGRNPQLNLRDGYRDRYVKRNDGVKEKLDHILRWILENRAKLSSETAASPSAW